MTGSTFIKSLEDVTLLLDRELDRCQADMTRRRVVRARYVASITRLEQIHRSSGVAAAARPWSLHAVNCDAFKAGVMQIMEAHRLDLSLHDADSSVAQRTLVTAVRRREAIALVLERERAAVQGARDRRERIDQDETAVQVWSRRRP
jgi:hypothetical protein